VDATDVIGAVSPACTVDADATRIWNMVGGGWENVLSQPIFPPNGADVLVPYYGAQLTQACSGCSGCSGSAQGLLRACSGTSQVAQTAQVSRG
jgi:hypothetical protein